MTDKLTNATRGRPPRNPKETDESKKNIVNAAKKLFATEGYAGVSMRKIAVLAECSPAFLYKLFPSKRHLLLNLWEETFAQLFVEMMECYQSVDAGERIRTLCLAYVDFWLAHPDDYRSIFLIEDRPQHDDEDYFVDSSLVLQQFDLFKVILVQAQQDGEIGPGDPDVIQNILFCAVQGLIFNLITIPEYAWGDKDVIKQTLIRSVLCGLR